MLQAFSIILKEFEVAYFCFLLTDEYEESRQTVTVHGSRPQAELRTSDKLHYIIRSPGGGVVQIGQCCILLRVNFSTPLVSRLLKQGDVNGEFTNVGKKRSQQKKKKKKKTSRK